MGLIQALSSAPGLRHFAGAASFEPQPEDSYYEPHLADPWENERADDLSLADADSRSPAASAFLVCEQRAVTASGQPLFSPAFVSDDDDLALSEDGYLINSQGQFLLGVSLDAEGRRRAGEPEVVRVDMSGIETAGTSRVTYRANLPAYPLTALADFEEPGSELLDKTLFARDPSIHGSGIVLGDERQKFLDRSLAGGAMRIIAEDGASVQLVLRWAKMTSLRHGGRDSWALFYRVRRAPRSGEVAWRNVGYAFVFGADGRLDEPSLVVPVIDMMIDGVRIGNISMIFGSNGVTQFADRSGLVKVYKTEADGCIGGEFTGISMSGRGRLFAYYANGAVRPLADIQFTGEELWPAEQEGEWEDALERRVA